MQGRDRDADTELTCGHSGEGENRTNLEISIDTHTTICKTEPVGAAACRGLISGPVITQGRGGGRGAKDGGDMCIPAADSLFVHQKLIPHGKAVILQSTKRKKKATYAPRGRQQAFAKVCA